MGRLSDEWCCMNCARLNECLMNEPDLNLLDYCISDGARQGWRYA